MTQAELNRIIDSVTKTMIKDSYDEGWNDALNHLEDVIGDLLQQSDGTMSASNDATTATEGNS